MWQERIVSIEEDRDDQEGFMKEVIYKLDLGTIEF